MKYIKEVPTEIDTEFVCVWVFQKQLNCNMFRVEDDGIKVLSSCGYYYNDLEDDEVFPWKEADEWDITIQEK